MRRPLDKLLGAHVLVLCNVSRANVDKQTIHGYLPCMQSKDNTQRDVIQMPNDYPVGELFNIAKHTITDYSHVSGQLNKIATISYTAAQRFFRKVTSDDECRLLFLEERQSDIAPFGKATAV